MQKLQIFILPQQTPWASNIYAGVVQLQARGPHVARHSVFSGPRMHSGKIFKTEICWKAWSTQYQQINLSIYLSAKPGHLKVALEPN